MLKYDQTGFRGSISIFPLSMILALWFLTYPAFSQRQVIKTLSNPTVSSIVDENGNQLDEIILEHGDKLIIVLDGRDLHLVKRAQLFGNRRVGQGHVDVEILQAEPTKLKLALTLKTTSFQGGGFYLQLQDEKENRLADVKTNRFILRSRSVATVNRSTTAVSQTPIHPVQVWKPSNSQARAINNLSRNSNIRTDSRLQKQLLEKAKYLERLIRENNHRLESGPKGSITDEQIDLIISDIRQIRTDLSQTLKNVLPPTMAPANECDRERDACYEKCAQLSEAEEGSLMLAEMRLICELSCEAKDAQCRLRETAEQQTQSAKSTRAAAGQAKIQKRADVQNPRSAAGPTGIRQTVSTKSAVTDEIGESERMTRLNETWKPVSEDIIGSIFTSATSILAAMHAILQSIANNLR